MSLTYVLESALAVLVLGAAAWTIAARSAFAAAVGFVSYGLLLALVWVQLAAVDVALTEAAIGSGLTGVLLLGAVATLRAAEAHIRAAPGSRNARRRRPSAARCVGGAGGRRADAARVRADARAKRGGAARDRGRQSGDGVLMAFRGFDTLLEKVVLVLALVGVWSLRPTAAGAAVRAGGREACCVLYAAGAARVLLGMH